jgi:hypothetical protein|tara:strand:+ start:227 stop:430 length:204 start_codon:yes stop_codon:yes gene_type:complete
MGLLDGLPERIRDVQAKKDVPGLSFGREIETILDSIAEIRNYVASEGPLEMGQRGRAREPLSLSEIL